MAAPAGPRDTLDVYPGWGPTGKGPPCTHALPLRPGHSAPSGLRTERFSAPGRPTAAGAGGEGGLCPWSQVSSPGNRLPTLSTVSEVAFHRSTQPSDSCQVRVLFPHLTKSCATPLSGEHTVWDPDMTSARGKSSQQKCPKEKTCFSDTQINQFMGINTVSTPDRRGDSVMTY